MKSRHLTYIEDGLLVGQSGPWTWLRLNMDAYDMRSTDGKRHLGQVESRQLENLEGYECQLLYLPRVYSVDTWGSELEARTPRPAPGWRPYQNAVGRYLKHGGGDPDVYLDTLSVQLRGHQLSQREVYLGVRLGGRGRVEMLKSLFRPADRFMGLEDPRPKDEDLEEWRREASEVFDKLSNGRPASASEVRWLAQRIRTRGLGDVPEVPSREAWGGEARALVDGLVRNGHRWVQMEPEEVTPFGRFSRAVMGLLGIRVYQEGGGPYVATLTVAYMPPSSLPGGEWLARCDKLPFPVEASVRFVVHPPEEAAKLVRSKLDAALDQQRHIAGTSAQLPISVRESLEGAQELEYQITKGQRPLIEAWPRFVVVGATKAELESRVNQTMAAYRRTRWELERPAGDQMTLFQETVPGSSTRSPFYKQTIPVETLAGGMYVASADLGDGIGCYTGVAVANGNTPVFTDLFLPPQMNRPTVFVYTGVPGGGKTATVKKFTYEGRMRGAWCFVVDPKGEFEEMTNLPGLGGTAYLRLDERYKGLLDPFQIEQTSRGKAALLAVDLCRQFLPPLQAKQVEGDLILAADAECQEMHPTMLGLIGKVAESRKEDAREAAQLLRTIANQPLAGMCFAHERTAALHLEDALTVISFAGLRIPDSETPREDYNIEDRLAVGLVHAVTALIRTLVENAPAEVPKMLVLDEAWMITQSAQGRRLVESLARTGRSRNTTVHLVSQNADDLLGSAITNNIVAKFCFRAEAKEEIEKVCELLGLEFTSDYVELFRSLESGWCVHQDIHGRVGLLVIDQVLRILKTAFSTTPGEQVAEAVGVGE